ncbi:putative methyltransferase YdaC-like [Huso huso]|uniref:Methyltransferase YdaC-like n=1 Tax=Huso huso TaxID=61971 RepID=A0ABR0YCL1_HUSHU
MVTKIITQHLGHPKSTLMGWVTQSLMKRTNRFLEENAVRLCEIQADNTVLEVGFGPGLGLQEAVQYLTDPRGKLLGLDYSEYMHKVARERLRDHIASGKVRLFQGRVESIPLPACSVDKVYHCNCHLYWPDMRAGNAELLRVMRPGALMVSTLNLDYLRWGRSLGFLQGVNVEPKPYLEALRAAGFTDVRLEEKYDKGRKFEAIFATAEK